MQLLRLGDRGRETPVIRGDDGVIYRLDHLTTDIDPEFLADDGIARARSALAAGLPVFQGAEAIRVGAPISKPGAVLCIGQNYAATPPSPEMPPGCSDPLLQTPQHCRGP